MTNGCRDVSQASSQARSTPLSAEEQEYGHWLESDFFAGGLQLLQPQDPFEEEKGESRTPSSCPTTPGDIKHLFGRFRHFVFTRCDYLRTYDTTHHKLLDNVCLRQKCSTYASFWTRNNTDD